MEHVVLFALTITYKATNATNKLICLYKWLQPQSLPLPNAPLYHFLCNAIINTMILIQINKQ